MTLAGGACVILLYVRWPVFRLLPIYYHLSNAITLAAQVIAMLLHWLAMRNHKHNIQPLLWLLKYVFIIKIIATKLNIIISSSSSSSGIINIVIKSNC